MALNFVSNFAASVTQRHLKSSSAGLSLAIARLSAGRRVLSARDDAAAMAIGSRLGAEVAGLHQARSNAGQGVSIAQVADGGMAGINDILVRMKTLAVQSGSGQLSNADRSAINTEFQALASEVDRISADTEFAGTKLLDGSTGSIAVRVGTGVDPNADDISIALGTTTATALGINGTDVATQAGADVASAAIGTAIDRIQTLRASLGASQNRLGFAAANIDISIENTEAARSGLMDLDVAREMSNMTSKQVLVNAGISMLAQANQQTKHVLRLLA